MIAAIYRPDGSITQMIIGSPEIVAATADQTGLEWAEWVGPHDYAIIDTLDVTHCVAGGQIVSKEASGA